jgi:hypothetical protein
MWHAAQFVASVCLPDAIRESIELAEPWLVE